MGRGHSGSTILDILLSNSKDVCGVGELIPGLIRFEQDYCSCNQLIKNCEFWSGVKNDFEIQTQESFKEQSLLLTKSTHIKNFFKFLFDNKFVRLINKTNDEVIKSIANNSKTKVVIDSSKEYSRGLYLNMLNEEKQKFIIYIVRSPFDIVESNLHRLRKNKPYRFLRKNIQVKKVFFPIIAAISAFSWNLSYFLGIIVKFQNKSSFMKIKYKDLLENPKKILLTVNNYTGIEVKEIINKIENKEPLENNHKIAGNQIRFQREIIFNSHRQKSKMSLPYKIIVSIFSFPAIFLNKF